MTSRAPRKGRPATARQALTLFRPRRRLNTRMANPRHQEDRMTAYAIGSAQEHLAARLELLDTEQDLTR
jgi:hypothetical protein